MTEDTVQLLFPTPFYQSNIDIEDGVLDYIKSQKYNRSSNAYVSNTNVLASEEMKSIADIIEEKVKIFFYEVCGMSDSVKPELVSSWINLHKKGDWAQLHKHYNSIVTGVLYLDVNEDSGEFYVYTQSNLFGPQLNFNKKENNSINSDNVCFRPKNGDLYLFPASMEHHVTPNRSDLVRISIAFNYMMRGTIKSEYRDIII